MAASSPALRAGPQPTVRARRTRRLGLVAAIVVLAGSNVVSNRLWPEAYLGWNIAVTVLLVVLARACGVGPAELGLGRGSLRRGLGLGALLFVGIAAVFGLALVIPATRELFLDSRAAGPLSAALFAALVRIPFGTVLLEETAFRGVLPALAGGGWWRGTLVSSALFGLWHVLPAMGLAGANVAVGRAVGGWGTVALCALAVVATFVAGIVLCACRRAGGHLVTPMLVHLATNSVGVLLAWWVVSG